MRERASVEIFLGVWGSLYRGVREREREKEDTWIASIGWGCDRAGLRGGCFIGVFWAYMVVDFVCLTLVASITMSNNYVGKNAMTPPEL